MMNDKNQGNNELDENDDMYVELDDYQDEKKMGFFQRIANVFVAPTKLFKNILAKPAFGSPILIIFILSVLCGVFFISAYDLIMEESYAAMATRYGQDVVDLMKVSTELLGAQSMSVITGITGAFTTFFTGIFGAFIMTVIVFVVTKILKVQSTFKSLFSICLHIAIVGIVGSLVYYILMIAMGTTVNILSLGLLMPSGDSLNVNYAMLSSISVFTVWQWVLVFFAVKVYDGANSTKAIIAVVCFIVLTLIITYISSYIGVMSTDSSIQLMRRSLQ